MAKDLADTVKKKMKEGWIRAWMAVEVLAVTKEAADSSLKKHIDMMSGEKDAIIYRKDFRDTKEAENPFKKGGKAYSKVVELELVSRRFENLVYIVMNYAPSSVEILEPATLKMEVGEAQGILNNLAELIHKFAQASRGCIAIDT